MLTQTASIFVQIPILSNSHFIAKKQEAQKCQTHFIEFPLYQKRTVLDKLADREVVAALSRFTNEQMDELARLLTRPLPSYSWRLQAHQMIQQTITRVFN